MHEHFFRRSGGIVPQCCAALDAYFFMTHLTEVTPLLIDGRSLSGPRFAEGFLVGCLELRPQAL